MLWKLLAGAGLLALAVFLLLQFGDAREREGRALERVDAGRLAEQDARADATARVQEADRVTAAVTAWGERKDALKPITLTSHETVTRYAATPAGAARCLDADRVRGLDLLDATLFPSAPADGGAGPLPANASTPAG